MTNTDYIFPICYVDGLNEPDQEARICRLFNAEKVEKLIKDNALWFSNINILKDERDENEAAFHEAYLSASDPASGETHRRVHDARNQVCRPMVSCWTKNKLSDLKMWEDYASDCGSICCVSTAKKIKESLECQYVRAGNVDYYSLDELNHRNPGSQICRPVFSVKDCMKRNGNSILPTSVWSTEFVKLKEFANEKEVRFILFSSKVDDKGINIPFIEKPFLKIYYRDMLPDIQKNRLKDLFGCPVEHLKDDSF